MFPYICYYLASWRLDISVHQASNIIQYIQFSIEQTVKLRVSSVFGGSHSQKEEKKGGGGGGSEWNREGDHRSHLIHPDYKVRLRLSDMGKSCLPPPSLSPLLI